MTDDGGLSTGLIFLPLCTRLKKLLAASVQLKIHIHLSLIKGW
jgi:hypothetical protein